jgi:outer membrane protein OmpA-like peptidoglycan-associated protein
MRRYDGQAAGAGQLVVASLCAMLLAAAPAAAQDAEAVWVDKLAEELSDCPAGNVAQTNPDGTRPDAVCTRQWVKGTVVRRDIRMSFDRGSAELTAAARATLDRFAAGLLRVGSFRPFTVEGHTDSSGGRALNATLSAMRARSVVDYLAEKGVDRSRLKARGLGFDRPLPGRSADDPANRRVEVVAR